MTTPAAQPTTEPAAQPTTDDMVHAMYRAFSCLVPGAAKQPDPALRERDLAASLAHYGAAPADLATIRAWLAARAAGHPAS